MKNLSLSLVVGLALVLALVASGCATPPSAIAHAPRVKLSGS